MNRVFQIGSFCFRVLLDEGIEPPENFMRFACDSGTPEYTYEIAVSTAFPQPYGIMAARREDLAIFEDEGLELRYVGVKGTPGSYACYQELDARSAKVYVAPGAVPLMNVDTMFLSLLAMERHVMGKDHLVLHCAYMQHGDHAILFSAPSGTGKTTQATLWEKHRGTRVVNGDKSLLDKKNGAWTANGWPVCGSSQVCHNESMPIRAIVMLSQGKENTIAKLTPFQAFSQIYSQITINFWNRAAQQRAMDLIEDLVTHVPVYHLSCTISEDAVRCLEKKLEADGFVESGDKV